MAPAAEFRLPELVRPMQNDVLSLLAFDLMGSNGGLVRGRIGISHPRPSPGARHRPGGPLSGAGSALNLKGETPERAKFALDVLDFALLKIEETGVVRICGVAHTTMGAALE